MEDSGLNAIGGIRTTGRWCGLTPPAYREQRRHATTCPSALALNAGQEPRPANGRIEGTREDDTAQTLRRSYATPWNPCLETPMPKTQVLAETLEGPCRKGNAKLRTPALKKARRALRG